MSRQCEPQSIKRLKQLYFSFHANRIDPPAHGEDKPAIRLRRAWPGSGQPPRSPSGSLLLSAGRRFPSSSRRRRSSSIFARFLSAPVRPNFTLLAAALPLSRFFSARFCASRCVFRNEAKLTIFPRSESIICLPYDVRRPAALAFGARLGQRWFAGNGGGGVPSLHRTLPSWRDS